ncbi:MAG TPA: hypothetical protein VE861_10145 [Gemmatimonadaceae bacterium]|nr:hypothetical protein [Gemmatimonadaceae bacterium]
MITTRTIEHDGARWAVAPSGFVTQNVGDEFGLVFTRVDGVSGEVRFSRYSPAGVRSRESSFDALSDATLLRLLMTSQPSVRAPEGGYRQ